MAAAESHFASGDAERAAELLQGVIGSAPGGLMLAEALHRLGVVRHRLGDDAAATSLFERALEEAGDDPSVRSAIERRLAFSVVVGGDIPRGAAHIKAALDLAEAWGDRGDVAESLGFSVMIDFLGGNGFAEDRMERAMALEDRARHVPIEWRPRGINAYILVSTGQLDRARSALETLRTEALEMGDESSLAFICHLLALTEMSSGDWARCDRHVEEGLAAATQTRQPLTEAFLRCCEALLDAFRGRVDRARETAERGLALAERKRWAPIVQYHTSVLGFLDLSLGDVAATHGRLGPLGDFLATVGLAEPGHLGFLPDEIEALVALGELDRAGTLLDMFEDRARALDRTWALATGARCRGLLEASRGDLPSALAALDLALEHHRRLPYPFELGRTLLAAGMVRRRAKQKAPAREPLERALEIFEGLGAPLWSKKAREELGRIGGRARGPLGLTPTEQKVADLVSAGRTNAEVASALFLSVGTVEAYLSRVYRKLGVRSRSELVLLLSGGTVAGDQAKP